MLIQTHQLDLKQLSDLDALCDACRAQDGNIVSIYRHLLEKHRGRPSTFLCYKKQLIGFLAAFFFQEKTCEIALMVAPNFRKKGVGSQLLRQVLPMMRNEFVQTVIFSSPHGINNDWFTRLGFCYHHSEYQMQRTLLQPIMINHADYDDPRLDRSTHSQPILNKFRIATHYDIHDLCTIDNACFGTDESNSLNRFYELLNDPNQTLFVLEKNQKIIGKAHLNWQEKAVRFTDIAIIPTEQRQGFGHYLLSRCINYALAANKQQIRLDVETNNKHALELYTRLGFGISNATDFWSISEIGLTGFL
jgi:ribosomal protein S18 acetylase RimI-like enzyme